MRWLPPRRWFQFRLSTWFVLVAFLAYSMVAWPWIVRATRYRGTTLPPDDVMFGLTVYVSVDRACSPVPYGLNPRLELPVLAVAVWLAGSGFWAISRHMKFRGGESPSASISEKRTVDSVDIPTGRT